MADTRRTRGGQTVEAARANSRWTSGGHGGQGLEALPKTQGGHALGTRPGHIAASYFSKRAPTINCLGASTPQML